MKKECENCVKVDICKKPIGIIWGFCNIDFVPKLNLEDCDELGAGVVNPAILTINTGEDDGEVS